MNALAKPLSVAALAVAVLGLTWTSPMTTARAATDVMVISVEPMTTRGCMQAAEELREKAKGVAGTALVAAHADEAEAACKNEDFAMASDALSDGYRWLRRKRSQGL